MSIELVLHPRVHFGIQHSRASPWTDSRYLDKFKPGTTTFKQTIYFYSNRPSIELPINN